MTRRLALLLSLVIAATLAACSSSGPAATGGGFVTVSGAWVREGAAGGMTAAYLQVTNGRLSNDTLVGVSTDAAQKGSLHETTTDQKSGMTGMQPVDGITIPAGKSVTLEPGGYHIMLEGLTADLKAGAQVRMVLTFEQSGPLNVTAEVRAK